MSQEPYVDNGRLIYAGRDCYLIPEELYRYGGEVKMLDLSFNAIRDLEGLTEFASALEELVLDNNELMESATFPELPRVTLLSLCNNQISDLYVFLDNVEGKLPSLTYLSLLGNRACPDSLTHEDCDENDYSRYRKYVIYKFPRLKFLDSKPVTKEERKLAKKQGPYLRVIRPTEHETSNEEDAKAVYNPLPAEDDHKTNSGAGMYRRAKYVYHGRHSEGNRFIRNSDL